VTMKTKVVNTDYRFPSPVPTASATAASSTPTRPAPPRRGTSASAAADQEPTLVTETSELDSRDRAVGPSAQEASEVSLVLEDKEDLADKASALLRPTLPAFLVFDLEPMLEVTPSRLKSPILMPTNLPVLILSIRLSLLSKI
jgi:hypothetical protein